MGLLDNVTPGQRKMLIVGAPVVGIAAIYSLSRGTSTDDDSDGGRIVVDETPTVGSGAVGVIPGGASTGAIGTGELSSFLNNVGDALTTYREQNTEAIDELRAERDDWQAALEDSIAARFDQEQQTPVHQPQAPRPPATPATPTAPTRSAAEQRVRDLFARYNVPGSYTHSPTSESADDRFARIGRELESGDRTYEALTKSVQLLADARAGKVTVS